MKNKVILFEANELPIRVLDDFVKKNPLSTLASISLHRIETISKDKGDLSPWITWPTVHRGINNTHHKISHLGQNCEIVDRKYPPIWKIILKSGLSVGLFGSLHSYEKNNIDKYAFYFPDVFSDGNEAYPKFLEKFQDFNLSMTRNSFRNVDTKLNIVKALKLIPYFIKLGFTLNTFGQILFQLLKEKIKPEIKVRRRSIQAVLSFDVFFKQLVEHKPDFVTFFTNHIAASMHRFWAASYPQDYIELKYDRNWVSDFKDEINNSMLRLDYMLFKLKSFVDKNPEYSLLLVSSMGQKATNAYPVINDLVLKSPMKFLSILGFKNSQWKQLPAMSPDYTFIFPDNINQAYIEFSKVSFLVNGKKKKFGLKKINKIITLHLGIHNLNSQLDKVLIRNEEWNFKDLGFEIVENDFKQGCTAYHIPEGVLLNYNPNQNLKRTKFKKSILTTEIAPYILSLLSIKIPKYMAK